jgi:hypothetical protein
VAKSGFNPVAKTGTTFSSPSQRIIAMWIGNKDSLLSANWTDTLEYSGKFIALIA